jgi:hypothetical protein
VLTFAHIISCEISIVGAFVHTDRLDLGHNAPMERAVYHKGRTARDICSKPSAELSSTRVYKVISAAIAVAEAELYEAIIKLAMLDYQYLRYPIESI